MKFLSPLVAFLALTISARAQSHYHFQNPDLPLEQRVTNITLFDDSGRKGRLPQDEYRRAASRCHAAAFESPEETAQFASTIENT